jgi:hypothetical protein
MVFKRLAQENGVFYTIYIDKEQISETKNDHATRKTLGYISLVRALGFILCTEDPLNLYKIESALESDKWCLNGWLKKIVFLYNCFRKRTNRRNQKRPCHEEISRTFFLCKGFWLYTVHRRPSKPVQNCVRIGIKHTLFFLVLTNLFGVWFIIG